MKYTERKEWLYDGEIFRLRPDVTTALKIHAEYIAKHAPIPGPLFLEVDRRSTKYDDLWHMPLDERTVFSRELKVPALVTKERPDWRLTKVGLTPMQKHKIWLANLHLQEFDWFPAQGDMMFFDGYRHMIQKVVLEPQAFWQQTNVWLGLICETVIPAEGDAKPLLDPSVPVPQERIQTRPLPEL